MAENGGSKRPDTPSPDQYEDLKRGADELRESPMSGESREAKRRQKYQGGMNSYIRYTGIGIQFTLMMLIPVGLGYWLDTLIDTLPWLTVAGATFGCVGGMVWVVKSVFRMESRDDEKKE